MRIIRTLCNCAWRRSSEITAPEVVNQSAVQRRREVVSAADRPLDAECQAREQQFVVAEYDVEFSEGEAFLQGHQVVVGEFDAVQGRNRFCRSLQKLAVGIATPVIVGMS